MKQMSKKHIICCKWSFIVTKGYQRTTTLAMSDTVFIVTPFHCFFTVLYWNTALQSAMHDIVGYPDAGAETLLNGSNNICRVKNMLRIFNNKIPFHSIPFGWRRPTRTIRQTTHIYHAYLYMKEYLHSSMSQCVSVGGGGVRIIFREPIKFANIAVLWLCRILGRIMDCMQNSYGSREAGHCCTCMGSFDNIYWWHTPTLTTIWKGFDLKKGQ